MTERRFYVADAAPGESIFLAEDQSRHLSRVLRLSSGDDVRIFDGNGRESIYLVQEIGRDGVRLEFVRDTDPPSPESSLSITLAVPLLKKSNTDFVLQKAVELGVTRFVPLVCKRSEIAANRWKADRAFRIAVEAAKQCGRAVVPAIAEPIAFEEFIAGQKGAVFFFYEGEGGKLPGDLDANEVVAITGPEGGWELSEVESVKRLGFEVIHLGGRILRAETAPVVAVSILQFQFGDLC